MDKPRKKRSPMNDEYIYRKFIVRPTREQVKNLKFRLKMVMRPFYGYKYRLIIKNKENEQSEYDLKMVNKVQGKHQKFYRRLGHGGRIRINKKGIPYKRQSSLHGGSGTWLNKPSEQAIYNFHKAIYDLIIVPALERDFGKQAREQEANITGGDDIGKSSVNHP